MDRRYLNRGEIGPEVFNSLEVDLFVLPTTCTLNLMSYRVRILRRKGKFWESFTFKQLFFVLVET